MPREDAIAAFWRLSPKDRRPERRREPRELIPDHRVAPSIREPAQRALEYARRVLPLSGPVVIVWFGPPGGEYLDRRTGRVSKAGPTIMAPVGRAAYTEPVEHPWTIFMSAEIRDPLPTVLHEARHLWQYPNGWYPDPTPCPVPGCTHLGHAFSPDDEDRLELDAFVWAAQHQGNVT